MASSGNEAAKATVGEFFDRVSAQYDDSIRRTIPPYEEMFEAVTGYTFLDAQAPLKILELGCGTGNLSLYVASQFPSAQLTLVDLSPDMLRQTESKLSALNQPPQLVEGGFMDVELPRGHFDLIVSSVALHHLLDADKPPMYHRINSWLKPGGLLRIADEVKTLPPEQAMASNDTRWQAWARENGANQEELNMWVAHAEQYDHYASLHDHFMWLAAAGFTEVDCYWKRVLWAVFGARKLGPG